MHNIVIEMRCGRLTTILLTEQNKKATVQVIET